MKSENVTSFNRDDALLDVSWLYFPSRFMLISLSVKKIRTNGSSKVSKHLMLCTHLVLQTSLGLDFLESGQCLDTLLSKICCCNWDRLKK